MSYRTLGPLDPIFDVQQNKGAIEIGNSSPSVPPPIDVPVDNFEMVYRAAPLSGSSVAFSWGSYTPTLGDVAIAVQKRSGARSSFPVPAGWTQVNADTLVGSFYLDVVYMILMGGDTAPTFTSSSGSGWATLAVFRGLDVAALNPLANSVSITGSGVVPTVPSFTGPALMIQALSISTAGSLTDSDRTRGKSFGFGLSPWQFGAATLNVKPGPGDVGYQVVDDRQAWFRDQYTTAGDIGTIASFNLAASPLGGSSAVSLASSSVVTGSATAPYPVTYSASEGDFLVFVHGDSGANNRSLYEDQYLMAYPSLWGMSLAADDGHGLWARVPAIAPAYTVWASTVQPATGVGGVSVQNHKIGVLVFQGVHKYQPLGSPVANKFGSMAGAVVLDTSSPTAAVVIPNVEDAGCMIVSVIRTRRDTANPDLTVVDNANGFTEVVNDNTLFGGTIGFRMIVAVKTGVTGAVTLPTYTINPVNGYTGFIHRTWFVLRPDSLALPSADPT